ncbi:MAG: hypothetical protein ACLGIF_08265 [Actinomycetes bacterium]
MRPGSTPRRARRGMVAVLAGAAGMVASLGGCVVGPPAGSSSSPSSSSSRSATPLPPHSIKDGHLTFTVLELECALTAVFGSHAEGMPEGRFCRSRLRVVNDHSEAHTYVTARQRLVYGGGEAKPDPFAMAVRRQLDEVPIGARSLVELEVWWDVPVQARVEGIKVGGDRDPVGFHNDSPVPYVPGGALIPVRPKV